MPKVATQWNSGATRDSNRGRRVLIPSALTTTPPSRTVSTKYMYLDYYNCQTKFIIIISTASAEGRNLILLVSVRLFVGLSIHDLPKNYSRSYERILTTFLRKRGVVH